MLLERSSPKQRRMRGTVYVSCMIHPHTIIQTRPHATHLTHTCTLTTPSSYTPPPSILALVHTCTPTTHSPPSCSSRTQPSTMHTHTHTCTPTAPLPLVPPTHNHPLCILTHTHTLLPLPSPLFLPYKHTPTAPHPPCSSRTQPSTMHTHTQDLMEEE